MGMYTIMNGEFDIQPPLNNRELRQVDEADCFSELKFDVHVEKIETDEGTLTKRRGLGVGPAQPDERVNNYHVKEQLQRLVDMFPDHAFSGQILCVFEEIEGVRTMKPLGGDRYVPYVEGIWAHEVRAGKVVTLHPVIAAWSEKEPTR